MKSVLLLFLLCLLAFQSNALICNSPAPQLHSVLDAHIMVNNSALFATSSAPAFDTRNLDQRKAANRREAGIYMTVFGTIAIGGAIAMLIEADRLERVSRRTPGASSGNIAYGMLGGVLGAAGIGLLGLGVFWIIYYSHREK